MTEIELMKQEVKELEKQLIKLVQERLPIYRSIEQSCDAAMCLEYFGKAFEWLWKAIDKVKDNDT